MRQPAPASASCLYFGRVSHQRVRPVTHSFQYNVCCLLADLDELGDLDRHLSLFSFNRWNVFSFFDRDHGPRDGSPLRPWIDRHLSAIGIDLAGGPVRVLCFPRLFGFVFNPLTFWFCYHRAGRLRAVLLEVSNMLGETHGYLLSVDGGYTGGRLSASFSKSFYVSAFIGMDASYQCDVVEPDEHLGLLIREFEQDQETLIASWTGRRRAMTTANLAYALGRYPLMTFKIWAAIYWQALRLIRKGVPRYPQASAPGVDVTYAGTAQPTPSARDDSSSPPSTQPGGSSGSPAKLRTAV
jgi:uncharacterized protein